MNPCSRSRVHSIPQHCLARFVAGALLVAALTSRDVAAQGYYTPVERPPKITQHPANLTIEQGQTAVFKVTMDPDGKDKSYTGYTYGTMTCQWFKNGARITGATTTTLTLTNAQGSDAASYFVVVTNKIGWVASNTVTLSVIITSLPTIMSQPVSATVTEGESATLRVAVVGVPAPTFRWRKNGAFISGATATQLTLVDIQVNDSGVYDVLVSNSRGSVISRTASLAVIAPNPISAPPPISIATQPASAALVPGQTATFGIGASGSNLSYQWKRNGSNIAGATQSSYTVTSVGARDMGFYSVAISSDDSAIESEIATLTVTSTATSRLVNLSTRGYVPAGGAMTVGFALRGTGPKQLLARAVGPTLARFGVDGALADPRLELFPAGATTACLANDDWNVTTANGATSAPALASTTAAIGAFALDHESKDAAALATVDTSTNIGYTARIGSGNPGAAGVVLAEIYDADSRSAPVRLAAVSTLGVVGPGDRALVPGFTIDGAASKRLLIRAIGPGLEQFGVTGALADPRIAIVAVGLHRTVASNDNASADPGLVRASTEAGAFPLATGSKDAAMIVHLPPGGYTVTVAGAGEATGTALVEIYDLDP